MYCKGGRYVVVERGGERVEGVERGVAAVRRNVPRLEEWVAEPRLR